MGRGDPLRAQAFEAKGAYFYGLKGSGLWIHVGKSIAFETHEDAALYFLKRPCSNGNAKDEELGIIQCDNELGEIVTEAKHKAGTPSNSRATATRSVLGEARAARR